MERLGMGVMIGILGGNEATVAVVKGALGKEIASLELVNDFLLFGFTNGTTMQLWDNGQSCCEERYMRTDDDLNQFIGATLLDIEIRDAPEVEDGGEVHEVQFLVITTSKGVFTMATHNEHNGYYGGFYIKATA